MHKDVQFKNQSVSVRPVTLDINCLVESALNQ